MSYILDALRRAQSERNRGSVPGLHTPVTATLPVATPASHPIRDILVPWSIVSVLGAVMLMALWWMWYTPPAVTPTAVIPAVVAVAAPPSTSVDTAATATDLPAMAEVPLSDSATSSRKTTPTKPAAKRRPPDNAATPVPSAPVSVEDLPLDIRNQLPALQLAGLTYSANPLHRMVIVNGQVLHEGESIVPDLVLERIEAQRTIWVFRGHRYAVPML